MPLIPEAVYVYKGLAYEANTQIPEADRFDLDYGAAGLVVIGATDAAPISIQTATAHGRATGDTVTLTGIRGNTAANGTFRITVVDTDEFTLDFSDGSGPFVMPGFTADGGTDTITCTGHGMPSGRGVRLFTSGTLPGGLSTGATYYVINPSTDTFQLSATVGGSAIDITDSGTGTHTLAGGQIQRGIKTLPASTLGLVIPFGDFLPWNVCSTPASQSRILSARHRVRSF